MMSKEDILKLEQWIKTNITKIEVVFVYTKHLEDGTTVVSTDPLSCILIPLNKDGSRDLCCGSVFNLYYSEK